MAYFTEDQIIVYENQTVAAVCVNLTASCPLERNVTLSVQKSCKSDISKWLKSVVHKNFFFVCFRFLEL